MCNDGNRLAPRVGVVSTIVTGPAPSPAPSRRRRAILVALASLVALVVAAALVVPGLVRGPGKSEPGGATSTTPSGSSTPPVTDAPLATPVPPATAVPTAEGLVTGLAILNPPVVACEGCWAPPVDTSWDWVLTHVPEAPFRDVDVYDIDGFEATAEHVDALHGAGIKAVCYLSGGTAEDWRPDFGAFPASVKGAEMPEWPGEYWLDVAEVQQPDSELAAIMNTRLRMCADKGFDAVEWDNVDAAFNDQETGLSPRPSDDDQLTYNRFLFNNTHALGMAVLLKNDPAQVDELVAYADGTVNEQCHEFDECDALAPFIEAGKPVFNAEYWPNNDFCDAAVASRISAVNFSDTNLDESDYHACN
jgi:hypothetical protein